jgi:hypothetical protein
MIVTPICYRYKPLLKINTSHSYSNNSKFVHSKCSLHKKHKLVANSIMPRFITAQVGNNELEFKKVNGMRKINGLFSCSQLLYLYKQQCMNLINHLHSTKSLDYEIGFNKPQYTFKTIL